MTHITPTNKIPQCQVDKTIWYRLDSRTSSGRQRRTSRRFESKCQRNRVSPEYDWRAHPALETCDRRSTRETWRRPGCSRWQWEGCWDWCSCCKPALQTYDPFAQLNHNQLHKQHHKWSVFQHIFTKLRSTNVCKCLLFRCERKINFWLLVWQSYDFYSHLECVLYWIWKQFWEKRKKKKKKLVLRLCWKKDSTSSKEKINRILLPTSEALSFIRVANNSASTLLFFWKIQFQNKIHKQNNKQFKHKFTHF